jgi:hypothetical protein
MFDDIISNIAFHETYVKIASDFIQTHVSHNIPINIIHLRLEDDAINHWCVMNSLPKVYYKIFIENKYIELIKTHLNKSDNNIIVTYDNDNAVINYMKEHHYNPIFIDKSFEGRERNAIVDFLISKHCNNIFIGNFHFDNLNGSSFSYLIMKNISENVKKICIDLDNIMDTEHIYYKV